MKKKENKKDSLFNVEITKKVTLKKELLKGFISTILTTIIVYLILVTYNYEIRVLLRTINEEKIEPIEVIICSFCIVLVVTFFMKLGEFLKSYPKKK